MFYFDPTMIILIPAILFSLFAQSRIQSSFNKYLKVPSISGISGAQAARRILDNNGLYDVPVEIIKGHLTDHYDPRTRTLRLSSDVYYGSSIASVGVAAHESGHAIQHKERYGFLIFRNSLAPIANIGSNLSWILIVLGVILSYGNLINFGILLFTSVVLFQIVTLPVEYNASSRALKQIQYNGILYESEVKGVRRVLDAAALTYVAATLTAILQLVRLLLIARDRD